MTTYSANTFNWIKYQSYAADQVAAQLGVSATAILGAIGRRRTLRRLH
jgi:hypothetical protein